MNVKKKKDKIWSKSISMFFIDSIWCHACMNNIEEFSIINVFLFTVFRKLDTSVYRVYRDHSIVTYQQATYTYQIHSVQLTTGRRGTRLSIPKYYFHFHLFFFLRKNWIRSNMLDSITISSNRSAFQITNCPSNNERNAGEKKREREPERERRIAHIWTREKPAFNNKWLFFLSRLPLSVFTVFEVCVSWFHWNL